VFDATNTTRKRRAAVIARCGDRAQSLTVTFCESICDDKSVLDGNLRVKAANSPDYRDMPIEEVTHSAISSFMLCYVILCYGCETNGIILTRH
jgi:hypothetical protein